MHHNNWNEGVGGVGNRVELVEHSSKENSLNTAQIV